MNVSSSSPISPFGCCDFQLSTEDNSIICGRSMEFSIPMDSQIVAHTRGETCVSKAPDQSTAMQWASKYGYVGIHVLHQNFPAEGMNEKGLSFGLLSLECTQYPEIDESDRTKALGISHSGTWILGNFATVDEVKEALKDVKIWGDFINPMTQQPMGLHIALHDAMGKNLVIEFTNCETVVHDNPIGVLTNDPDFPFHQKHLSLYNYLNPERAPNVTINGHTVPSLFKGDSMYGLPGDWSSTSRFIKVAVILRTAVKVTTARQGVNLAQRVLNNVDRIKGTTVIIDGDTKRYETTQWATIKDLTNKFLFYRTEEDLSLRLIRLNALDFSKGKEGKAISIATGEPFVIDMTEKLS